MKKLLLVSVLLAILFGLQGCWYSKMTHFDEDDLKWVEWANVGDSLLFRSDSGIIDTWIISEVHVYDIHNPIVFFNVDPGVFEANAAYYMENSKDKMLSGALFICKKEKEDSLYICAYLQGRFLKKSYDYIPPVFVKFKINNKEFSDCMVFDDTNTRYSPHWPQSGINKMESFIISREYGLLWYRFEDGQEYWRINI
jgi:hypothetical protein